MKIEELTIAGTKFKFLISHNEWCEIVLHSDNRKIVLGADSWEVIKTKLNNSLSSHCYSSEPQWVMSLAEKHHSLYRQNNNGKEEYFWQDANANEVWRSVIPVPLSKESLEIFNEKNNV